jgi:hypothetical protein
MLPNSLLSILAITGVTALAISLIAQEEPITEQGYEREELGVNPDTARSIEHILQQLNLRPRFNEREARGLGVGDRVTRHSASR